LLTADRWVDYILHIHPSDAHELVNTKGNQAAVPFTKGEQYPERLGDLRAAERKPGIPGMSAAWPPTLAFQLDVQEAADMNEIIQRRYTLFVLFVVAMFNYVDRNILAILQVPIKHDLGLSDAQLGALTGLSFALVYSTLALPVARLADRGNRARLIAGSLVLWSAMTALSGLAGSFLILVLLRIGVAAGESGSVPATHSIIADLCPRDKRATILALSQLSMPLGTALGFIVGGQLDQLIGWRTAFALVGLTGLLLGPLVWLTMKEPVRGRFDPVHDHPGKTTTWRQILRHLWGLQTFRYLLPAGACQGFAMMSVLHWNAPFYARVHGLPLGKISLYLALTNGVGFAVGIFAGGHLSDYFGRSDPSGRLRVVFFALVAMVPFALAQYLVRSTVLSMVCGAIVSTFMVFFMSPQVAVPQLLVPSSMRAFTSAIVLLTFNLVGLGLGPFITGYLSDVLMRHGSGTEALRYALCASMLLSALASVLYWRASTHLRRELPMAPSVKTDDADAPTLALSVPAVSAMGVRS